MQGFKREAKRGYGRNSLRGEMKFSIKKNKKYLTRLARHHNDRCEHILYSRGK